MSETIIQKARGHLGSAISQSIDSDDRIIMDHVKAAYELLGAIDEYHMAELEAEVRRLKNQVLSVDAVARNYSDRAEVAEATVAKAGVQP